MTVWPHRCRGSRVDVTKAARNGRDHDVTALESPQLVRRSASRAAGHLAWNVREASWRSQT